MAPSAAVVTSDFGPTTGQSGKAVHTMVALDESTKVIGAKLVKPSEPIVPIGIPQARVADDVGLDPEAAIPA